MPEDITHGELEVWLERAQNPTTRETGMSVSCPKCWRPVSLNGRPGNRDCQCGTVATPEEVKRAFGVEGLACYGQSAIAID